MKKKEHTEEYYRNHAAIKATYVRIFKEEKRMPSQGEVAKILHLTLPTISTHLSSVNMNELILPFKLFGSDVLRGLKDRAEKGDARAARLFFMLVFDFTEKREIKADVKANVKAKVGGAVTVKVSEKIAKIVGDALAAEATKEAEGQLK